jgi:hypothetical protein
MNRTNQHGTKVAEKNAFSGVGRERQNARTIFSATKT